MTSHATPNSVSLPAASMEACIVIGWTDTAACIKMYTHSPESKPDGLVEKVS